MKIFGNEMVFDENGLLTKIDFKINSIAKSMVINDERIENRKNLIILGDIKHDVNMAKNVNADNVISIGFLNSPCYFSIKNEVKDYLEVYDVVVANRGSWREPLRILNEILGQ